MLLGQLERAHVGHGAAGQSRVVLVERLVKLLQRCESVAQGQLLGEWAWGGNRELGFTPTSALGAWEAATAGSRAGRSW